MPKKSFTHSIRDTFSLKHFVFTAFLVGFLFFVFAWVPYKKEERQLKLLEQHAAQTQSGLQEFRNLLGVVARKPSSLNQAGIAYHLRSQTEAASRMLEMIDEISIVVTQEKEQIENLPALIFYPNFSKEIKARLNFETPNNEEQIGELKTILRTHKTISQALLNLIAFDPDVFFDKPFSSYDSKEIIKKINSLSESMGKTKISLAALDPTTDEKVNKVLALVESEHQRIISMIDAINEKNYREADRLKSGLAASLTTTRGSLDDKNIGLLKSEIDEKYFQLIDQLLGLQVDLLQDIDQIQEEYF